MSVIYNLTNDIIFIKEKSDTGPSALPHNRYDIVTKDAIKTFPEDILQTVLTRSDFKFLELIESEFTTVEARRTDSLIKVLLDDEIVLVHIEFQVDDSSSVNMVRRNVGYLGRCYEQYGLPILSHVIYLRPKAGRQDPGGYRQNIPNHRFIVEYKVIRLIELDGKSVFESNNIGLTPFAPLMQPPTGMDRLRWVVHCNDQTKTLSLPVDIRNNLLVSQWVLSGLIHTNQTIGDLLSEEVMQESSVYQHLLQTTGEERYHQGLQQGTELGVRINALESLLQVLEYRFDPNGVKAIRPTLEKISDVSRLKQLHIVALRVQDLSMFIQDMDKSN